MTSLGLNDLEPCGTRTARRRHTALAEYCRECETPGRQVPLPTLAELVERRRAQAAALDRGAA